MKRSLSTRLLVLAGLLALAAPVVAQQLGRSAPDLQARLAFLAGELELFQVVFARSLHNEVHWTRAGLYQSLLPAGACRCPRSCFPGTMMRS